MNAEGLEFVNEIVGGSVPKEYIPAVQKGIEEQMQNGVVAGYPLLGLKATLYDGSFHDVDSNEMAFKVAASLATRRLSEEGGAVLLEPVMAVEVVTPEENMGDVVGDLNRRRGLIGGMDENPSGKVVTAEVPLGEMFGYATDLRSRHRGVRLTPWSFPSTQRRRLTSLKKLFQKTGNTSGIRSFSIKGSCPDATSGGL